MVMSRNLPKRPERIKNKDSGAGRRRQTNVTSFDLSKSTCFRCRADQGPPGRSCAACGATIFAVEIERSSWGFDPELSGIGGGAVGAFVEHAADDAAGPLFYRTHALLRCDGVSGNEIAAFLAAPVEERRRMYVDW